MRRVAASEWVELLPILREGRSGWTTILQATPAENPQMNLSAFEIGDHIGVHAPNGDQFFIRTKDGLEGPYIDRECTIAYMDPALEKEIKANAMAQRHYLTGKRRRNKEMTMSDGATYKTDGNGVIHRVEPKVSKKERRRLKDAGATESK